MPPFPRTRKRILAHNPQGSSLRAATVRRRRFAPAGTATARAADEALLKEHYKDLAAKPFFPSLLKYMTSGPVVPMVWEGNGVVAAGRAILGATKPSESAPGTVRGECAPRPPAPLRPPAPRRGVCARPRRRVAPSDSAAPSTTAIDGAAAGPGDYAVDVGRNVCHGSDGVETAKREIGLWFPEGLTEWASHSEPWIYE